MSGIRPLIRKRRSGLEPRSFDMTASSCALPPWSSAFFSATTLTSLSASLSSGTLQTPADYEIRGKRKRAACRQVAVLFKRRKGPAHVFPCGISHVLVHSYVRYRPDRVFYLGRGRGL